MPFRQQQQSKTVAPSEAVTFQKALQEWHYMANVLFENLDCVKHAPSPVFAVNELKKIGENEIPDDVADDNMEDFRINHMEKVWRQVAVL